MVFRPLFLASIVLVAITAAAQVPSPFDNNVSRFGSGTDIAGRVYDLSGHPISGARVEAHDLLTGQIAASAYTFPNGTYDLRNVPQGRYEVVATLGISESRTRIDSLTAGNVDLRLNTTTPMTTGPAGEKSSVSVSQLRVPSKARKFFQKAMAAFRRLHHDQAYSLIQKALGVDPDYAQALALRGVLKMQSRDYAGAQPDLEKAVHLDDSDNMSFVALASLYNTQGDYDHALQVLDHGMSLHPNSWQALTEAARAQIGKKQYARALNSLQEAGKLLPPDIYYPHLLKAQALMGLHDKQGAIAEARTYLTKRSTGANADTARRMLAHLSAAPTRSLAEK